MTSHEIKHKGDDRGLWGQTDQSFPFVAEVTLEKPFYLSNLNSQICKTEVSMTHTFKSICKA